MSNNPESGIDPGSSSPVLPSSPDPFLEERDFDDDAHFLFDLTDPAEHHANPADHHLEGQSTPSPPPSDSPSPSPSPPPQAPPPPPPSPPPPPHPNMPVVPAGQAGNPNPAPAPAADKKPTAAQINSITAFSGVMGQEAELFVDSVNRAKTVYAWTDEDTASAAMQKMTGSASSWLKHLSRLGTEFETWETNAGLKKALLERFLTGRTLAASVGGLAELQQGQRATESVAEFVERLSAALDKKNFDVTEANKKTANYIARFKAELVKYLLHGLREEFKTRVIGVPNAPEDLETIVSVCKRAEEEKSSLAVVHAISSDKGQGKVNQVSVNQVNQAQSKNAARRKGACFTCGSQSHWADRCPQNNRRRGGRGGQGGGGGFQGGQQGGRGNPSAGNSGRSGGWTNPNRNNGPTNAIPYQQGQPRRQSRSGGGQAYVRQVQEDPQQSYDDGNQVYEYNYSGNAGEGRD